MTWHSLKSHKNIVKVKNKLNYDSHQSSYSNASYEKYLYNIYQTRRSGRYAPILLAPSEGWGALQAPRALRSLLGAFSL